MTAIAREVGVSVRTLHRYFATKSDIVWGPIDVTFRGLRDRLAASPDDLGIVPTLARAIVESFSDSVEDASTVRTRLRLIATNPELQANNSEPFQQWRQHLVNHVARRLGCAPDCVEALAIGVAVQSATMAALGWWAVRDGDESPQAVVSRALLTIEQGHSSPSPA